MFVKKSNINMLMVLRVIGWLLMIEAIFMCVPLAVSLYYSELESVKAFFFSVLLTFGLGSITAKMIRPSYMNMHRKEGFLLTSLVWVVFSIFGMLPFLFSGTINNVTDAFYETMAGFTTTGSTIFCDVEILPKGILLWRSLMQWIGGMGIILFTLAVIPMLNKTGGVQLFNAEVTGITHDKLRPKVSQTAMGLWGVYIGLTIVMSILLCVGPMDWFDSLCHTLSCVSTGGFSTKNASIGFWDSRYIDGIVIVFMFLGGVSFTLLYNVTHGKYKSLFENEVLKWYVILCVGGTLICFADLYYRGENKNILDCAIDSLFHIVATITTTGFTVENYAWGQFSVMMLIILMISCACAGSTSGGLKIDRMLVMLKNVKNEFSKAIHPNLVTSVRMNGKVVPYAYVQKLIAFFVIFMLVLMVSTTIITIFGISVFDSFFMSLSALCNVGYGSSIVGGDTFVNLPILVKWLLTFDMLIGRLELFTVLILFTKGFWIK